LELAEMEVLILALLQGQVVATLYSVRLLQPAVALEETLIIALDYLVVLEAVVVVLIMAEQQEQAEQEILQVPHHHRGIQAEPEVWSTHIAAVEVAVVRVAPAVMLALEQTKAALVALEPHLQFPVRL
jgi:hypothetical protein